MRLPLTYFELVCVIAVCYNYCLPFLALDDFRSCLLLAHTFYIIFGGAVGGCIWSGAGSGALWVRGGDGHGGSRIGDRHDWSQGPLNFCRSPSRPFKLLLRCSAYISWLRNQVVSTFVWLWWVIDLSWFEFKSGISWLFYPYMFMWRIMFACLMVCRWQVQHGG
jgi:hypothetical protein